MEIKFTPQAIKDIEFWKKSGNNKIQNKITSLLKSIKQTPILGIGKPEKLKHDLSCCWSRRIDKEHRIVYQVFDKNNTVEIHSLKGHY